MYSSNDTLVFKMSMIVMSIFKFVLEFLMEHHDNYLYNDNYVKNSSTFKQSYSTKAI